MGVERTGDSVWQERFEELDGRIEANRADIDALQARAEDANHRAATSEARADASETRADANHHRIEDLETRADIDGQLISELQAEGVLNREHSAQLEEALHTSRMIGAAIGIIMAKRQLDQDAAFQSLRRASQHSNRKLRILADEVVHNVDPGDLLDA